MARLTIIAVALLLVLGSVNGQTTGTDFSSDTPSTHIAPETDPSKTTTTTTTSTTKLTTTTTKPTTTTTKPTTTTTKPTTTTTTPTTTTTEPTTTTTTTTPTTTTTKPTTTTDNATTTTTTEHTTTTDNSTTTTNNSTTTTETTTTDLTTPKPTPIPEQKYAYNVTSDKLTCIMFQGAITFTIDYEGTNSKGKDVNMTVNVTSPAHPQKGSTVKGSCGDSQSISFDWLDGKAKRNASLLFSRSKDKKTWTLDSVKASIFLDPETFEGAIDANETLEIEALYTLDPSSVAVNKSFACKPVLSTKNVTGEVANATYDMHISSSMKDVKIQAYNLDMKAKDFGSATLCSTDVKTNDIIPIIVGCCLGGLVVIVLIAYLVGRRKKAENSLCQNIQSTCPTIDGTDPIPIIICCLVGWVIIIGTCIIEVFGTKEKSDDEELGEENKIVTEEPIATPVGIMEDDVTPSIVIVSEATAKTDEATRSVTSVAEEAMTPDVSAATSKIEIESAINTTSSPPPDVFTV